MLFFNINGNMLSKINEILEKLKKLNLEQSKELIRQLL
jgi:hypothetical protein